MSRSTHMVLLVEGDLPMAAELGVLLATAGLQHRHAVNDEEALGLLDAHADFCMALVDLEIEQNASSLLGSVETGFALLERIRARYPERTPEDQHRLPVLVMSHWEHQIVVRAFQQGASDFVNKILSANEPGLEDRILEALRRSGRPHHALCVRPSTEENAVTPLVLSARPRRRRTEIVLGDRVLRLTTKSLLVLMKLLVWRVAFPGSWATTGDLVGHEDAWKTMSRVREELAPGLPPGAPSAVENDRGTGAYRLAPTIRVERVDWEGFEKHADARIRRLARGLEAHMNDSGRPRRSGRRSTVAARVSNAPRRGRPTVSPSTRPVPTQG